MFVYPMPMEVTVFFSNADRVEMNKMNHNAGNLVYRNLKVINELVPHKKIRLNLEK